MLLALHAAPLFVPPFLLGLGWFALLTNRRLKRGSFRSTRQLEAAVADGKIEATRGSAKVRAAVWFSGLGRQTFKISESAAASVRFDLFGATMRASAIAATLRGDELDLGVALTEERRGARR